MLEKRELEMRGSEILKEMEGISGIFSDVNKTFIVGRIEKKLRYSHEFKQEKFFKTRIEVIRNSGIADFIPVMISEKVLAKYLRKKIRVGNIVEIAGSFYSFNTRDKDGKTHLKLFLSAKYIKMLKDERIIEKVPTTNIIYLNGFICKNPVLRKTHISNQYITDLLIAVNRPSDESDYIPCIVWKNTAKWAQNLKVGEEVELYGRIQSRQYFKKFSDRPEHQEYIDICKKRINSEYVQYRKYEEFKNPIKIDPSIGMLKIAYEISIIKIQRVNSPKY